MLLIIIFSFYLSIYNPFCYYFRSVLWCKDTNYYVIIGKEIAMGVFYLFVLIVASRRDAGVLFLIFTALRNIRCCSHSVATPYIACTVLLKFNLFEVV